MGQKVSPHHRGRRKAHILVRTSTIFGADVHDPKGCWKTLYKKSLRWFLAPHSRTLRKPFKKVLPGASRVRGSCSRKWKSWCKAKVKQSATNAIRTTDKKDKGGAHPSAVEQHSDYLLQVLSSFFPPPHPQQFPWGGVVREKEENTYSWSKL